MDLLQFSFDRIAVKFEFIKMFLMILIKKIDNFIYMNGQNFVKSIYSTFRFYSKSVTNTKILFELWG